jgi:hypothetical protein
VAAVKELLLKHLDERVLEHALVDQAELEEDAIKRRDKRARSDLRGDAVIEENAVAYALRGHEERGARQATIEHVDQEVHERRADERALRRRRRRDLGAMWRRLIAGDALRFRLLDR